MKHLSRQMNTVHITYIFKIIQNNFKYQIKYGSETWTNKKKIETLRSLAGTDDCIKHKTG